MNAGDTVPDFVAETATGASFHLYSELLKGPVVLFFYPKSFTPNCTAEACSFRDAYQDFVDVGAQVVGISQDKVERQDAFAQKHQLPYTLLSDPKNEIRKKLKVPGTLLVLPGRVTYVVSKQGKLLHMFNSQMNPERHVQEALGILKAEFEAAQQELQAWQASRQGKRIELLQPSPSSNSDSHGS